MGKLRMWVRSTGVGAGAMGLSLPGLKIQTLNSSGVPPQIS
jgi:hypothetical protein